MGAAKQTNNNSTGVVPSCPVTKASFCSLSDSRGSDALLGAAICWIAKRKDERNKKRNVEKRDRTDIETVGSVTTMQWGK